MEDILNKVNNPTPKASQDTTKQSSNNNKHKTSTPINESDTKKLIYGAGGMLIGAGAMGIIAIKRGRIAKTAINTLQKQVDDLSKAKDAIAEDLKKSLTDSEGYKKIIGNLKKQVDDILTGLPEGWENLAKKQQAKYEKMVSGDITINYNPMKPICEATKIEKSGEIALVKYALPTQKVLNPSEILDTNKLTKQAEALNIGEVLTVPFSKGREIAKKASNAYSFSPEQEKVVGIMVDCDKAMKAGKTANWSEEKIARDILQNFYDGHGHTLDGVGLTVTKTSNNTYKVRITGQSTYNCEYIKADGLSTKGATEADLFDAGGFGEGLKMVNVSMLWKKLTSKITYGSANWEYDITPGDIYMQRTLRKVKNYDGNFVEFETNNLDFVKKLINASNYFEHSKNPDFKGATIMTDDFGFEFLGKSQKGNLYLTQRFEYGENGAWENGLEGLNMFFRRKPSASFSQGRDRTKITSKDLKDDILPKFLDKLTDEKKIDLIMKMQSAWTYESRNNPKAYKVLLEALCDSLSYSGKKIDFSKAKYVAISDYEDSRTIERLREYGYTICNSYMKKAGMPETADILKMYSTHEPLQPTQLELKKMHLLGEATKIVSELYTSNKYAPAVLNELKEKHHFLFNGKHLTYKELGEICDGNKELLEKCESKFMALEKEFPGILETSSPDELAPEMLTKVEERMADIIKGEIISLVKNIDNISPAQQDDLISLLRKFSKKGYTYINIDDIISSKNTTKNLILPKNPHSPVYIFDRTKEKAENTLGEAIIKDNDYLGHWVDRSYLEKGSFSDVLATWLHEMLHQYAGDGTPKFTYKLTDILGDTFTLTAEQRARLKAIQHVYEGLSA